MITTHRIASDAGLTQGFTIIIDSAESAKRFMELVQRGTNLWPDAHPEIKEFSDEVTNGEWLRLHKAASTVSSLVKGLQDYKSQATDIQRKAEFVRATKDIPFIPLTSKSGGDAQNDIRYYRHYHSECNTVFDSTEQKNPRCPVCKLFLRGNNHE